MEPIFDPKPDASRRDVLRLGALTAALVTGAPVTFAQDPATPTARASLWSGYPRHDLKTVAEIVGAAHFDEKRVRELVAAHPELVNAWWDWGFGDWESPLGAAAHVGERGIAEFLLGAGARMDIFAAAMLGQTAVVKAFVAARPGIQGTLGPHGLTLLSHARAGGEAAAATAAYLEELGGADEGLRSTPLSAEERQKYLGAFSVDAPRLKMVTRLNRNGLLVADFETPESRSTGRLLHYLAEGAFFPAGVPSVRIWFRFDDGKATAVTVGGTVPELTLQRADP